MNIFPHHASLRSQSGQSLVEAVVAIGIVVLLVAGLVSGTTSSLRASQHSTLQSQALHFAQEGIELTRSLRDKGWIPFTAYGLTAPLQKIWCLDANGVWSDGTGGCLPNVNATFTRSVTFSWNNPRMDVIVDVTWNQGDADHKVELVTAFTQWK